MPGRRIGRAFVGRLAFWLNPLGVPGRRVDRAFVGRLASGPNPLGVPGQRVGRAFVGRLASELNPFWALGSGRLARGAGLGPKVPTMGTHNALLFSYLGGRSSSVRKKNQVDHHIIGNSLPLMLLNFQRKFCDFFVTALDAIRLSISILRFRSNYKRRVGEKMGYLTGYPRSIVGVGQLNIAKVLDYRMKDGRVQLLGRAF